jgi:hypothetical protein
MSWLMAPLVFAGMPAGAAGIQINLMRCIANATIFSSSHP